MRTNRNSIKGYKINYSTNTISMNYKFAKSAQDFGSAEYKLLKALREDFPMMTTVVETGRKIDTTKLTKRLTYANILEHISAYSNSDELIANFERAKELSKPLASPYKYVRDWFDAQFPEFRDVVKSIEKSYEGVKLVEMPDIANYKLKEDDNNYLA